MPSPERTNVDPLPLSWKSEHRNFNPLPGDHHTGDALDEAGNTYGARLVEEYIDFRGTIDADVAVYLDRVKPVMEKHRRSVPMGKLALEAVAAHAFYDTMIRPFLLKGTLSSTTKEKTYAPGQTYLDDFASQMLSQGAISQMYIRLLQSRPGEKPIDSRIGYGALELLRTWAIRTKVAKELDLQYSVNIVDETGAFDHGDQLGFTPETTDDSHLALQKFIERCGLSEQDIRITPFSHQSDLYRESTTQDAGLTAEYGRLLEANTERTVEDIRLDVLSLNAIRAVMIHRLRHGDSFESVSSNRDFNYLEDFHPDDVTETIRISESFNSALQMRPAVKRHIGRVGLQSQFPEFFSDAALLHWGISKKSDRLSIQPNFKGPYGGRLATPGYALPVYEEVTRKFMGLTSYSQHLSDEFEVINGPNGSPAALVKGE